MILEDLKKLELRELLAEEQVVRKERFDARFRLRSDAAALKDYRSARTKLAQVLTLQTAKRKAGK